MSNLSIRLNASQINDHFSNGTNPLELSRDAQVKLFLDVVHQHTPKDAVIGTFEINPQEKCYEFFTSAQRDRLIQYLIRSTESNMFVRIAPLAVAPKVGRGYAADSLGSGVLWHDIDKVKNEARTIKRLNASDTPPTLIISSGYGIHAYWLLEEFCRDLRAIKARNKWIREELSPTSEDEKADSVFDLARVMRVPGTYNLKYDDRKLARILEFHPDRIYSLDDFDEAELEDSADADELVWDAEVLPGDFLDRLASRDEKLALRIRSEITAAQAGATLVDGFGDNVDRSKNDMHIANRLLALKHTPEEALAVLTHPAWFSGAKARERGYDYAVLTVQKALAWIKEKGGAGTGDAKGGFCAPDIGDEATRTNSYMYLGLQLRRYDNGVFHEEGEIKLRQWVQGRLGRGWKRGKAEEVVEWVRVKTYVEPDGLTRTDKVCLLNGVLDLATKKLLPHDPKYKLITQLPINYDPDAESKFLDDFIAKVITSPDAISVHWEFLAAAAFRPDTYQPKAFLIYQGPSDSGKSKVAEYSTKLLGSQNVSAVSLHDLAENRFMAANIFGKLANIFSDLSDKEVPNGSFIKVLTGDDYIEVDRKNKGSLKFKPTAKQIFTSNDPVPVRNPDKAYFNRATIILCAKSIPLKKQDPEIMEKLTQPEVMSAALNRMIEGWDRLEANKWKLSQSLSVDEQRVLYRATIDSVAAFLDEWTHAKAKHPVPRYEMLAAYKSWCKRVSRHPVTDAKFYRNMIDLQKKYQFLLSHMTYKPTKTQEWCYVGRELRTL